MFIVFIVLVSYLVVLYIFIIEAFTDKLNNVS